MQTRPGAAPSARRVEPKQQRGDIQGMRALAVLLVMMSHAAVPGFAGGFVGVDVFFVISGFLITGILVRESDRTGRISIASFYARRARRILPAGTVVLVATVAVSALVYTAGRLEQTVDHVIWAAFFAANIYSARSGSDYFSEESFRTPVLHFWSLAVEEQFYLVWPALIALVLFALRRWTRRRATGEVPAAELRRTRLRWLVLTVTVIGGVSLAWSVHQTQAEPISAYYSSLTRGWELCVGALLALCAGSVARLPGAVKAAASWLGLVAIAVAAYRFSSATPFPGYQALLPVLGAALLLGGGIEGPRRGARVLLDVAPLRWVGDISYSLYLWHWPFLVLPAVYLARDLTLGERVVTMVGATAVAWLSYRFVETPIRESRRLAHRRGPALALWPAAALTVVAVALLPGPGALATRAEAPVPGGQNVSVSSDPAVNAVSAAVTQARAKQPLPEALTPSLKELESDISLLPSSCTVERDDPTVRSCVLGDTKAKRTVVIFGDSHAVMWLRPIEKLAEEHGWRVIPFRKAGCFPLDASLWWGAKQRVYTECDTWRENAYAQIAKAKPDMIITSGLLNFSLADPATGKPVTGPKATRLLKDGLSSSLARLNEITPNVHVIGGTPFLAKAAADCLGSTSATMATCVRAPGKNILERNALWSAATKQVNGDFIDPVPWLCYQSKCPVVVGNIIVYRDSHHITTTYAATLERQLESRLHL
ncbi:acyltransferase family protein [Terrabacter terrigena]|uniref:Acyltransferase family protein n=1 Tax=Terrabacter terrigena TaxID=574718 RepID=A0ABW3N0F8_9MICO